MFETVKRIVNFLEYELSDEDLNNLPIILPKFNDKNKDSTSVPTDSIKHYQFEGVVGDWVNYFSPKDSQKFDEMMKKRFESIGLSLCSEPIDAMKRLSKNKTIIIDTKENLTKSQTNNRVITERPKMEKKEYLMIRNQSLSKIEIIDESVPQTEKSKGCWLCHCLGACCPCYYCKLDYTNV